MKELELYVQEESKDLEFFLQPFAEQMRGLDHFMRAVNKGLFRRSTTSSADRGKLDDDNYIDGNLMRSRSHFVRAFFDIADFCSLVMREKIRDLLAEHSNACITATIPRYYSDIRPDLDRFAVDVAGYRAGKDVISDDCISVVRAYRARLDGLVDVTRSILSRTGALIECEQSRMSEEALRRRYDIKVGVLLAVLGAVVGAAFGFAVSHWLFAAP